MLNNEDGQSLFELIVFLPVLLLILTVMVTVGNAINSSINQQKVTRSYYYYVLRGNSLGLNAIDLKEYGQTSSMSNVGMFAIGWRRSDPGQSNEEVFATCFRFSTLFSGDSQDVNCDEPNVSGQKTSIIRLYTAYGLCTEVYTTSDASDGLVPAYTLRAIGGLCSLIQ